MQENTPPPLSDPQDKDMARLEMYADWLDSRFRIPGTNWRFGLDALLGLIPYVGDIAGFIFAFFLMRIMVRRGAGPIIMTRMFFNHVLDALVGTIPLLGDLFDFSFKANRRNLRLLQSYYAETPNPPGAGWSFALLVFLFIGWMFFLLYAAFKVLTTVLQWLF